MSSVVKHSSFDRHRFGVNYTPSRNWWYCWNDWDDSCIERDLDAIAGLGADHIRIMAMWTYFQPNPGWVSPTHLDRLDRLMRLAAQRKLDVCVSMLNGHLTGQNFRQGFEGGDNLYTSPRLFEAVELYFRKIAEVVRPHPNLLGLDIGNEMNCCWHAPTLEDGDAWMDRVMKLAEQLLPDAVHVNGVDQQPWFWRETFSPRFLACRQQIISLHCWIFFTGALKRGGPLDPPAIGLAPAMAALARAYADEADKPVWVQEYGASEQWMPAATVPEFCLKATRTAAASGINWFTWWASHDIGREFLVNPLEYSLGLLDVKNRVKPVGEAFRTLVREFGGKPVAKAAPTKAPPAQLDNESTWAWLLGWIKENIHE